MIENLTSESFSGRIGETFRIRIDDETTIDTVLSEVAERPRSARLQRTPFSLLFHGPKDVVLPQRIYVVEHGEMGTLQIFLVTVGPDDRGMRYEAVFS